MMESPPVQEEWVGREKAANCTSASAARRCGREEKKGEASSMGSFMFKS